MEKLIWNIYKGLSVKDEFEFHICSLVNHGETFMISEFRSVPSEVLILNASNNNYKISDYMRIVKTMFILARYVAKNKIDIVHSHDFFSAFVTRVSVILCIILWWHKPQQNIVTLHNLFFWLRKPHRVINKTLSFFTDKIICVSKSVFENSYKNDKIKKERMILSLSLK
jgi:glycogen synthase